MENELERNSRKDSKANVQVILVEARNDKGTEIRKIKEKLNSLIFINTTRHRVKTLEITKIMKF